MRRWPVPHCLDGKTWVGKEKGGTFANLMKDSVSLRYFGNSIVHFQNS